MAVAWITNLSTFELSVCVICDAFAVWCLSVFLPSVLPNAWRIEQIVTFCTNPLAQRNASGSTTATHTHTKRCNLLFDIHSDSSNVFRHKADVCLTFYLWNIYTTNRWHIIMAHTHNNMASKLGRKRLFELNDIRGHKKVSNIFDFIKMSKRSVLLYINISYPELTGTLTLYVQLLLTVKYKTFR